MIECSHLSSEFYLSFRISVKKSLLKFLDTSPAVSTTEAAARRRKVAKIILRKPPIQNILNQYSLNTLTFKTSRNNNNYEH